MVSTMRGAAWLILIVVVGLGWSSARAATRDPDVPLTNARNDWWMIGKDAKHTTSKCIGNPKTALCAVETVEACLIRREKNLCRIGAGPLKIFLPDDHVVPETEKYRINRARRLTRLPSWETPSNGYGFRHVGDILVEIQTWDCDATYACEPDPGYFHTFLVRLTGQRWSVAGRISCDIEASGSSCVDWPYTKRR